MKKLFLAKNKNTVRMTLENFFDTLSTFYRDGITNSPRIHCKYYCQESTFRYELHDNDQPCFTRHSLLEESEIFDLWNEVDARQEIIDDIVHQATKYNKAESSTEG